MIMESILGLALSVPADPSLKCPGTHHLPGYDEDSAVVILDNEILGSTADFDGATLFTDGTLQPSEIANVEHTCWDPESDELPAARGVPVIVIGTFSGQAKAESETLDAARLVHAFVAEHARLPTTLEEVAPSLAGYSIGDGEMGWWIKSSDIEGVSCSSSQLGSLNEEVLCNFTYSVVKQRLREALSAGNRLPD